MKSNLSHLEVFFKLQMQNSILKKISKPQIGNESQNSQKTIPGETISVEIRLIY